MTRALRGLFDIRQSEWPQVLLLALTFLLFIIGLVWAGNTVQAEVLARDQLTTAILCGGLGVILASLVYTAFVDRVPKARLLIILTLLGIGGLALLSAPLALEGLSEDLASLIYLALYTLHQLLLYIWVIHWGTFINDLYDTRTAKRIFPLLAAARPLATILSGVTLNVLTGPLAFDTPGIMLAWIALLGVVLALLVVMPRLLGARFSGAAPARSGVTMTGASTTSGLQSVREGLRLVRESSFLRWLAVFGLLLIAINAIVQYETTNYILDTFTEQGYNDPRAALRSYTAMLDSVSSLIALVIQLFVFQRVLKRTGLGNMNLVYPLLVLGTSTSIVFLPTLLTNALAYVTRRAFRRILSDPVTGLLYNAVPAQAKGRARAVIIGLISPAGSVLAALMLMVVPGLGINWLLPVHLLGAAVLYVGVAFVLRRGYTQTLVKLLQGQSFSFLLAQQSDLGLAAGGVTDSTTLTLLFEQLRQAEDDETRIFMASLIGEVGGRDALAALCDYAREAEGDVQLAVLNIIVDSGIHIQAIITLYSDLIASPNNRARELALSGFERLLGLDDRNFLSLAADLLDDPVPGIRARVIPPLLRAGVPAYEDAANDALKALLTSDDPVARRLGVETLGDSANRYAILVLLDFVNDADNMVRRAVALAIYRLWEPPVPDEVEAAVVAQCDHFLHDPVQAVRLAELRLLVRLNTPPAHQALLRALGDPAPRIRQQAAAALVEIGQPVIPQLEAVLAQAGTGAGDFQPEMAATVLARLLPQQYAPTLFGVVERALLGVYATYHRLAALAVCDEAEHASLPILETMLHDDNEQQIARAFALLQTLDTAGDLQVVREALGSDDTRTRANAVEALEALSTPRIAALVAPLFDPEQSVSQLDGLYHVYQGTAPTDSSTTPDPFPILMELAQSGDPWRRAVVLFTLGEIGSTHPDLPRVLPELGVAARPDFAPDPCLSAFRIEDIVVAIKAAQSPAYPADVRVAAQAAQRILTGRGILAVAQTGEEDTVLSIVERMIMLKEVTWFQELNVEQLRALASICDERLFLADEVMFEQGDPGGALYIVVRGTVHIGIRSKSTDAFTKLASYAAKTAFGEMSLFRDAPRSATAIAAEDTLTLRVRAEPLRMLIHQEPDLALELVRSLTEHLRDANQRIASLTSSMRHDMSGLLLE